jgi:endonuclease III
MGGKRLWGEVEKTEREKDTNQQNDAMQVRKVIWDLFALCPTAQAAVIADVAAIEALIQPLGLFRKRAVAIQRLSR